MKILMLIDSLGVGGAESHVEILATELAKMGHEIIVASAGGVLCKRLRGANVRCVFLPKILKNGQKSLKKRVNKYLHCFIIPPLPSTYIISNFVNFVYT